jgi:uncharacterized protein
VLWLALAGAPEQVAAVHVELGAPGAPGGHAAVPSAAGGHGSAPSAPSATAHDSVAASLGPGGALAPAPDPGLVEEGRDGQLPIIGKDGRQPWKIYARPFDRTDKRPRIAVVMTELGLANLITDSAIRDLPAAVTLAFSPYGRRLGEAAAQARAAGHEVLLGVPMEPLDFARQDPGPQTLLTSVDKERNGDRLDWLLSRFPGYVGVVPQMGARFLAAGGDLRPVLATLKSRGLLFVDNGAAPQSAAPKLAAELGLPAAAADRTIDGDATRAGIERRLGELEETARRSGAAIGLAQPYPVSIERIAAWAASLEARGLVLAPVSATVTQEPKP